MVGAKKYVCDIRQFVMSVFFINVVHNGVQVECVSWYFIQQVISMFVCLLAKQVLFGNFRWMSMFKPLPFELFFEMLLCRAEIW